ncbi:hypothetical protein J1N35_014864 [Gossypium stocksii]|uniref:Uncharacterized protein n=1 Tax=Gossypium stocksii TaxID=47602 RepID=A0A9D3VVQ0_9ROSI|nr:hypothetical protein J1N35_014864 [Gossypium stocksii]
MSLNCENEENDVKDEIAITATKKGKDPVPPTPPASTTAQDCDIYHLINELIEIDKKGDEINPMKRKLRYKVSARKSTCKVE